MLATPSKWDSELFGVRVGHIRALSLPDLSEIRASNVGAFDVVFVVSEGWHEPSGAIAIDWRYEMEASAPPAQDPLSVDRPDDARVREIIDLAGSSFSDSRFLRDPRLSGKAPDLYRKWCFDAASDGRLLACTTGPLAFCAFGRKGDGWRVELIAVDPRARGHGIGRGLLAGAAKKLGFRRRICVSARNYPAIRSYESSGFRVDSISTAFHVWP